MPKNIIAVIATIKIISDTISIVTSITYYNNSINTINCQVLLSNKLIQALERFFVLCKKGSYKNKLRAGRFDLLFERMFSAKCF